MSFFSKISSNSPVTKKVTGGLSLDGIADIKSKVAQQDSKRQDNSSKLYKEAVFALKKFTDQPVSKDSLSNLQKIAEKLIESLQIKKNQPEPYLLLSYIFLLIGEKTISLDYLKLYEQFENKNSQSKIMRELLSAININPKIKSSPNPKIKDLRLINSIPKIGPPNPLK